MYLIVHLLQRLPKCFVLSSCTTVSLVDSSPEMLPPGYFVSSGSCFQRCSQLVISSLLEVTKCSVLSLCTTVSLVDSSPEMLPTGYFVSSGPCFLRCFQMVISSLLEVTQMFCALLVHHSLSCRLFSRDVTTWLFRLFWILFPEMSQLAISSLLEVIVSSPPALTRGLLKFS